MPTSSCLAGCLSRASPRQLVLPVRARGPSLSSPIHHRSLTLTSIDLSTVGRWHVQGEQPSFNGIGTSAVPRPLPGTAPTIETVLNAVQALQSTLRELPWPSRTHSISNFLALWQRVAVQVPDRSHELHARCCPTMIDALNKLAPMVSTSSSDSRNYDAFGEYTVQLNSLFEISRRLNETLATTPPIAMIHTVLQWQSTVLLGLSTFHINSFVLFF